MSDCTNCGRPVGTDSGLGECTWLFGRVCIDAARTRQTHDALRRELADAKAEVERLRKLFDDAGQGEHNVLALVDHYIAEAEKAERERDIYMAAWVADDDLRTEADELRRLAWEWCIDCKTCADYGYHTLGDVLRLRTEAEELRALAWEWCIEARSGREALEPHERHYSKLYHEKLRIEEERDELRAQLQRLTDDAYEVDHRGNCPEPPIESLGPVPVTSNDLEAWENDNGHEIHPDDRLACIERALAYVIRDAKRRGAKLEGT